MTVGMPAPDASAALRGSPAFLQGKVPGATSPKGPLVQARAVFGGVAPARPDFRTPCAGRTARMATSLPNKALPWMRLLRLGPDGVALAEKTCCNRAFSPQQRASSVALAGPQPLKRRKESVMTVRMAITVVTAVPVAQCFHAQHPLWPVQGTVPIFDMTEFRDPSPCKAYQSRRPPALCFRDVLIRMGLSDTDGAVLGGFPLPSRGVGLDGV